MGKLIAIRHGQSTWNAENRFTGWVDVDLSEKGVGEAEKSGKLYTFNLKNKKTTIKYADKNINENEANALIMQLEQLMTDEALYKNSLISMPKIAKRLGISPPKFSQLLNDNLNKSFATFINEYRINAAKALLMLETPPKAEIIAEQCGFNSQSTFYSTFKKITSVTPAQYKANLSPKL